MLCRPSVIFDTSNAIFNPVSIIIPVFRPERNYLDNADRNTVASKLLISYIVPVNVGGLSFQVLTIPQVDGSFVTRAITENFNANGQGNTEEEALADIKDALELLLEEVDNPSGDVSWPKDCQ